MILDKNMKAMICSPDGDTDFYDVVADDLKGDL